ncbi:MAG: hypothetical protein FWD57_15260, partial [Polyangiaceae bacterium]|nr:hypothetical protein [Polyangiaceae bacterium]
HQFGAVIVPVKAKFLRWGAYEYSSAVTSTYKSGKRKGQAKTTSVTRTEKGPFFAKKVTIPARPFLPLSGMPPELQNRLEEATIEALTEHFGGK